MRSASRPAADAALVLAIALLAVGLPVPPQPAVPCEQPRESAAREGLPWTAEVACGDHRGRAVRGPARLLVGQRLDLNRADSRTLEVLPTIGPARSAAVVRARRDRPFASLDDLQRVSGIGPRTLARLRDWRINSRARRRAVPMILPLDGAVNVRRLDAPGQAYLPFQDQF